MTNISDNFLSLCYEIDRKALTPQRYGVIVSPRIDSSSIFETRFDSTIRKAIQGDLDDIEYCIVGCSGTIYPCIDYHFLANRDERTYAFFFLESKTEKAAVFNISTDKTTKLWINYALCSIIEKPHGILVANLKQGLNIIILESPNSTANNSLYIRTSDYITVKGKSDYPCLCQDDMIRHEVFGSVYHTGTLLYTGQPFEFIFFHRHDILAQACSAQFTLIDTISKKSIFKIDIKPNQHYCIDLPVICVDDYNEGHFYVAEIKYTYDNNYEYNRKFYLLTHPIDNMIEWVCEKAEAAASNCDYQYNRLCIRGEIEYIKDRDHKITEIAPHIETLIDYTRSVEAGNDLGLSIFTPGSKCIYFFNPMYNAVNYYQVFLPENYSPAKKYPLIISHSTFEYNGWNKTFKEYWDEPVIAVDISGRGILLGSYIGEAAIKLALDDVLHRFSVDPNRIYATGFSNGAGATWSFAEAYPDIFAGIFAVSGNVNTDLIGNLNNLCVLQLSSDADFLYNTCQKISELLKKHASFKAYFVDGFTHDALIYFWHNRKVFHKLLESQREEYPQHVEYKTIRNRHRKAYWLEIHAIADGSTEGTIDAQITSPNRIEVFCSGITGFSITIPPQICSKHFEITINGKSHYLFKEENRKQIHFSTIHANNYTFFEPIGTYIPIKDVHKGNGLLDVYLDPLSIVVPVNGSHITNAVALSYSEPHCQGFIPKVYIKYPIVNYDALINANDIADRSYVVIDDGSNHALLCKLRLSARIAYDCHGWEYNGKKYIGQYCIQQIVNSPWNPSRNIHLISYNDEKMLRKNLFTRKLIIPSYVNGRHTYLNNDALIFDRDGYHGVLDYSCNCVQL